MEPITRPPQEQQKEGLHVDKKTTYPAKLKVLKIQRSCVHDGPGIRTTIFFRGCRLRCLWCQNPEALSFKSDKSRDPGYSISDIMEVVSRDKAYYQKTGGGVTLSGGDPLSHDTDGLVQLLELLKEEKIHVTVETSLHAPFVNILSVAQYVDLFLVDLKMVGNDNLHKKYTKQDSSLIHSNIEELIDLKANIKFRMVMVPGYTDSQNHIEATANFLKSVDQNSIELLKYHRMGEEKAGRLNMAQASLDISDDQSLRAVKDAVKLFKSLDIETECYELEIPGKKAVFTQRVCDIQNAIREEGNNLCFEVSTLKTRFYKKHGFNKPTHIHRAERLSYVLRKKEIIVYPKELLVGNFTSKRVAGQVWEEHYGALFASILYKIDRQKPVAFKCSFKDKLNFYFKILPFWARRSLVSKIHSSFSALRLSISRCSEMNVGFNNNIASIAHFVVNFSRILELGTTGIIKEIEAARNDNPGHDQDFYAGAIIALQGLEIFAQRYAESLSNLSKQELDPVRKKELEQMAENCKHVPKNPARTYHEALQSMMLMHIALCIESHENAVSHGRLDQILYPYYQRDKAAGILDYDKAKELLALFVLKMDEAILVNDGDTYLGIGKLFETMSTDQTVTAGGLGKDGKDATNDLTYMLLDICELQPYAVNMTARVHENSPKEYLDRISEVYISGAPMPALYNDEVYIETLTAHFDTSKEDARNYSIIGCVEPNASDDHFGNTDCANMNVVLPFLQALKGEENDLWNHSVPDQREKIITKFFEYNFSADKKISRIILSRYKRARKRFKKKRTPIPNPPKNMGELLERFQKRLNHLANSILADHKAIEKEICKNFTTPLASSLFKGCIESGKDVNDGGAKINSSGIQGVGITDVADSLHAIDVLVFKKKMYQIDEIIDAIENDFKGKNYGQIRSALLNVPKFGHDKSQEAINWVNKVLQVFVTALNSVEDSPRNGIYAAGYYALNVNDVYGAQTPSLPSGRMKGVSLANSITPHYGMQSGDLLSSLNSVAGVDFAKYAPNGTTVTFTIDSAMFLGPAGVNNLSGIISTFFKKGGMQFQPNIINKEVYIDAYNHPEKHKYLLVRIAGYCAYFNDLSDELKKIIINRTCYS